MAIVGIAGNVAQQLVHSFVQFFVAAVRHLQLIFAVRPPLDVVFVEVEILNVLYRAFLAAHELAVVLDPQRQQDDGDLGRAGVGAAVLQRGCLSRRLLVGADRYAAMP